MRRKRGALAAAAVVIVGGLVAVAVLSGRVSHQAAASQPSDLTIDASVPEHKLLQDALRIDMDRQSGESRHFAMVPASRPPDLLRMGSGSNRTASDGTGSDGTDSVVDSYQFGEQWLHALVELSEQPTETCASIRAEQSLGMCVRDGDLDAPALRHLTVYFTGNVSTTPRAGDPETDRAQKFWSETDMVPITEAAWFADLVARGKAAADLVARGKAAGHP
ncbi:hypothetical protein FB565_007375 [Actinoplanes lutulentus]|uniref:Uncharacterized protein n=1 Tax=Actinoplanes lutulentus TaxID=1287878 RepID=A0A327Z0B6_9ACTN|nr:hypothetical protein [Actinoplanes lutulentus]MBB2947604.1 hypothetical protein [Actinoplanes lutulentus]RAK27660.1 hypothetical protein B0I29_12243 [Actinoplanes lutulentus]